jgi:hypothetical protein
MPITKRCVREFSGSLDESQALLGMSPVIPGLDASDVCCWWVGSERNAYLPGDSMEEVDKKHVIKKIRNNGMLSSFHFFITVCQFVMPIHFLSHTFL